MQSSIAGFFYKETVRKIFIALTGTPSKKDDGTITFWAVNIVEDISG